MQIQRQNQQELTSQASASSSNLHISHEPSKPDSYQPKLGVEKNSNTDSRFHSQSTPVPAPIPVPVLVPRKMRKSTASATTDSFSIMGSILHGDKNRPTTVTTVTNGGALSSLSKSLHQTNSSSIGASDKGFAGRGSAHFTLPVAPISCAETEHSKTLRPPTELQSQSNLSLSHLSTAEQQYAKAGIGKQDPQV